MKYRANLESQRLTTRFLKADDADVWTAFFENEYCAKFLHYPKDMPADACAVDMIQSQIKRYDEQRYGLQAIILKDTGEFLGMCGLITQEVAGKTEIEIGYHFLHKHWGKGYATEAAQLFRDYGFEQNVADSIISIIHPLNTRSQEVAKRNGMILSEPGTQCKGGVYDIYRINRAK